MVVVGQLKAQRRKQWLKLVGLEPGSGVLEAPWNVGTTWEEGPRKVPAPWQRPRPRKRLCREVEVRYVVGWWALGDGCVQQPFRAMVCVCCAYNV